ncbi:histidine kinase response regulator hybrid protein [Enhygromyxa salina]|uniref:histidine kinase n=1 Tax=Enhygromyxa salina TaxID=215803 RepID=A0A0C2CSH7_9BACT|nr:histidine kinase response regulator hybrid protein [Enhygromyxa salina]
MYAAVSERDDHEVVAKVFDIEDETDEDRVQHEFELIRSLELDGVVKALELRRVGDQLVLILQRVPGVDLAQFAAGKALALEVFWQIATQIADILARTHAARVIHRDIKPTNILIDPSDKRISLADFGISVLLESERRHIYDSDVFIGTLPYISPEQTGRTGRPVDFRSDLYSLGATFFELLTGRQPFADLPPLELIHAHLAKRPASPASLRAAVPDGLSRVVMKLLEKAPERRYQTAAGLAADLRSLQALHEAGQDDASFELGGEDFATSFVLSSRLYGREQERAALAEAFAAVAASKQRRSIALTGPLGVGKSALISDLEVVVVAREGYMIRGKFDPFREQPYLGFVQAFTSLFEQILSESDARLARWRRQLLAGLAGLAGVVVELCPIFELIVGSQEVPAQLGAVEAGNRLQIALERLLAVVCTDERPVVLALEGLHWAGQGSARLLEALMHGDGGPLLLLLSLRTDQLSADHPLASVRAAFGGSVQELALTGLPSAAIESLVVDSLPGVANPEVLAQTLARKTGGVPLFIGQLLTQLATRGLLRPDKRGWSWDQAAVEAEPIPDDAVALMSAKLDALSHEARDVIRRAACIGPRFDVARVATVCDDPRSELAASLFELEQAGLLARVGAEYRFTHESIQDAAQRGLDAAARQRLHWAIGQELLESAGGGEQRLFEVVEHLHEGLPADLEDAQRLELARLDLRAGERALDAAAYDLAERYLGQGIALTEAQRQEVATRGVEAANYELVFQLHFHLAYALALAGRREQADQAFAELLDWRLEDHHFGEVVARRVRLLWVDTRHPEAVELGLAALARLGVNIPQDLGRARAGISIVRAWRFGRRLNVASVDAMRRCQAPRDLAIIGIIAQLKYPAFTVSFNLFLFLVGQHTLNIRARGFHPSLPRALSELSAGVCGGLGRVDDGMALFDLGLTLARRDPTASTMSRLIALGGGLALHRGRSFAEIARLYDTCYQAALEAGEFDPAAFMGGFGADLQLELGTHLHVLNRRCVRVIGDVGRQCPNQMRVVMWTLRGACDALTGSGLEPRAEPDEGSGDAPRGWMLDPDEVFAQAGVRTNLYVALTLKAMIQLVLGEYEAGLATCLRSVHDIAKVAFNTWFVARTCVLTCVAYYAVVLAGGVPVAGAQASARKAERLLRRWVKHSPTNYGHYVDIAVGLRLASKGQIGPAVRTLDRAWAQARKRGCRWLEGLAAEQLAALLEREDMGALVRGARRRAWDAYAAWGAEAKLAQLREAHGELFVLGRSERARNPASDPLTGSILTQTAGLSLSLSESSPALDLAAVLRSVGAITEDLRLEEVIRRLLDATLTSVGADRGLLVLEQAGELTLVARGNADGTRELLADPPLVRDVVELAPVTLINFVVRTGQAVVLDDARVDLRFAGDAYLEAKDVRSVLALPLLKGERRLGALVLENRLTTRGFSSTSVETLKLITRQAASTLENAQLYSALHRSEARWRSLVDGAPDLIALLDERGRVVFRNHSGPLTGIDSKADDAADTDRASDVDDASDDADAGRLEPESAQRWREAVEAVLFAGQRFELELEYVPHLPHRQPPRWYAVRVAPIELHRALGRDGEVVRRNAVAVATDITARKQAERDKQQLEGQLRQQQRLESVGTLASGVAHEINNPVQGIMNYADLIAAHASEPEVVMEFAGEITHESQRVATIVRNLLAFSRQDAEDVPEAARPSDVVEATLSLVRSVLRGDHIAFSFEAEPELPLIRCRSQQIQQVVMNLVTNARDALKNHEPGSAAGKRIDVRVGRSPRPGWVRIGVEDSGGGIPIEVQPRIFDPFFTTKSRNEGTGLGLALSHGIVAEHGGELSFETELGVGTRFLLELPGLVTAETLHGW